MAMALWESWRKQVAQNITIISLFIAATALSFLILLHSSSSSSDTECKDSFRIQLEFTLSHTFQQVENLSENDCDAREKNHFHIHQQDWTIGNANASDAVKTKEEIGNANASDAVKTKTMEEIGNTNVSDAVKTKEEIIQQHQLEENNTSSNSNKGIEREAKCDIYSGKWVHDDSYPLYPPGECPYVSAAFNCKANGRHDSDYTKWRWQPSHCNLPRLNPMDMLERLRGKRLMFVGDSINRNQWESLVCILTSSVPQKRSLGFSKGGLTYFHSQDYNCSVEFFWAPFLVEQGSITVGNKSREILRLDAIDMHRAYWRDVDILVFNTGHWWTHGNKVQLRDFYMEGEYLHPELDPLIAFKTALTTWAKWIDDNINLTKTKVFFRGFSPNHFSSSQWNKPKGHKCNFEKEPFFEESYVNPYPARMKMIEEVIGQMKISVSVMNITRLSEFRKDAHPSIYTVRGKKKLTVKQQKDPDNFGDCSHWCLPGLPDMWNELLYGSLVMDDLSH